jgi:hypothetical protein
MIERITINANAVIRMRVVRVSSNPDWLQDVHCTVGYNSKLLSHWLQ